MDDGNTNHGGRRIREDRLVKGRRAMIATQNYTEADRLRELVIHAREGSPIAAEAVRAHLRNKLAKASPRLVLELAERMMQLGEKLSV